MSIRDGWVSWATRVPGVPDKVYTQLNSGHLGLIGHSVVGSYEGALARFLSVHRLADGSYAAYSAASCMFIVRKSGELVQMYPVWAATWTSGGRVLNCGTWPLEAEGGAPGNEREPLTPAQIKTIIRLCGEWEKHTGRTMTRATFLEHGTAGAALGYAPTSCPSGRYAGFYDAYFTNGGTAEEDQPMTPSERAELDALRAMVARIDREGVVLGPPAADGTNIGYNLLADSRTQSDLIHELRAENTELRALFAMIDQRLSTLEADGPTDPGSWQITGEVSLARP